MFFSKNKNTHRYIANYFKNKTFQRLLIGIVTIFVALIIVESGAAPKRYELILGDKSKYDITAPRDIENKDETENNARIAEQAIPAVMTAINTAPIDVLNEADKFINFIETARKGIEKSLQNQGIDRKHKNYKQQLAVEQAMAASKLSGEIKNIGMYGVPLSSEQTKYLVSKATDDDISNFNELTKSLISNIMKEVITDYNLANKIDKVQNQYQNVNISQDLKIIGGLLAKAILQPNIAEDKFLTDAKRQEARENALKNKVMISKGDRVLNNGDIITADKLKIVGDLGLLKVKGKIDLPFFVSILGILLFLAAILVLYMKHFCKRILYSRNDLILLSLIIIMTLLIARGVYEYSPLAIPISAAAMLISILLDLKLAGVVNFMLAISISFITKGDLKFIYVAVIGGTLAAFLVSKATQRSSLSLVGVITGGVNVLVYLCIGIIYKDSSADMLGDSIIVFFSGLASVILTIGILPFLESAFNIVTPLKLLELANPNQPLIKRLLMEAPGTYHHSLMVGNLAEVATEAIGGNALLARVGSYFHDVGKLNRPGFFKENQMSDNPHDKLTANLSTLVITSHTKDGVELAEKHKIPLSIREIISQHHGTTLVAYFYHKAKKGDKGEEVKQENFRYEDSKPTTKEAAVVMLADSVEAAVRAMVDKTEGKIEGLIRKLIKEKLDDGQLDLCDLTLRDLDNIAKGFIRVLSGYFHEREQYPEIKIKAKKEDEASIFEYTEPTKQEEPQVKEEIKEEVKENIEW